MSTFKKITQHPITKEWEDATWRDDYFGDHNYGVEFPSDKKVYDPRAVKMITETSHCLCRKCPVHNEEYRTQSLLNLTERFLTEVSIDLARM